MLALKRTDNTDMNTLASEAIHSYLKDGYRIDAKESVVDKDKDKDCTFKAVLKKDVDGVECKTVIKVSESGTDDKNKTLKYHKVETVGDTKWSEETKTYSSSVSNVSDLNKKDKHVWATDTPDWLSAHLKRMKHISDKYGFGWDWFDDDTYHRPFERLDDVIKINKKDDSKNETSKYTCKCPSAYKRLDDYIKPGEDCTDSAAEDKKHIKVNAEDTEKDIYNKIVEKKDSDKCDKRECKCCADKESDNKYEDDLEDSLVKLVRFIFGR